MKAQINSTVFIYILGSIVVAVILLFGFIAIKRSKILNRDSALEQTVNALQRDINSIRQIHGSVKNVEYSLPSQITEICYVDIQQVDHKDIADHPLIKDSVKNQVEKNLFLFDEKNMISFNIQNAQLMEYPYYLCLKADGHVYIKLQSIGGYVNIIRPTLNDICITAHEDPDRELMCAGLDIAYGEGYKSDCCEQFNLCC